MKVRVHECPRPSACTSVESMCVQTFVCLHVELLYGKTFPCCLRLVCAGAILSCSRDCHGAPRHSPWDLVSQRACRGQRMCVCGVVWCWGMLEQGFVSEHRCSQHCALCKRRSLAPAGRICSRLATSKPPGPAKLTYWPPMPMVPLPAFVRPLERKPWSSFLEPKD